MNDPQPHTLIGLGKTGQISAKINQRGAELWTLTDRDGTPLLWSGDPQVWSGRAPILFPIVGSLADGVIDITGAVIRCIAMALPVMPQFSVVEQPKQACCCGWKPPIRRAKSIRSISGSICVSPARRCARNRGQRS